MTPWTEAAKDQHHFVVSTILRRKDGTQWAHRDQKQVIVVLVVLKKVGILINRGSLLHPRTTAQDTDAILDIQGIVDVRVRVRVLDLHFPLQDAIVMLPLYLNWRGHRKTLKLVTIIHVHRA